MILRLTSKLLKLSKVEQTTKPYLVKEPLQGEWFANTLKTGHAGKTYLLFFHKQTKISFVFQTKSLKIALEQLPTRLHDLLNRIGLLELYDRFELDGDTQILNTNCRSTLAFMNNISFNYTWHLYETGPNEKLNNLFFEKIALEYLYKSNDLKKKYETALELLSNLKI
jgi:hypothetical protein